MEFGSKWAYLKADEDIESVSESESSSNEDIPAAPGRLRVFQRGRGASAPPAVKPKGKKKKWRLQQKGDDDGKVIVQYQGTGYISMDCPSLYGTAIGANPRGLWHMVKNICLQWYVNMMC